MKIQERLAKLRLDELTQKEKHINAALSIVEIAIASIEKDGPKTIRFDGAYEMNGPMAVALERLRAEKTALCECGMAIRAEIAHKVVDSFIKEYEEEFGK